MALRAALPLLGAAAASASAADQCHLFPGLVVGSGFLSPGGGHKSSAGDCCSACGAMRNCAAWTWHSDGSCFVKDNAQQPPAGHKKDPNTTSGLYARCPPPWTPLPLPLAVAADPSP